MEQMTTIWDKRFGRSFLKMAAMMTMLCDHIAVVLIPKSDYPELYNMMRLTGRIAFPLFCFMLVEGFIHTHSRKEYIIRLALFAVISEIPFDIAVSAKVIDWNNQNVMWTLLIGFIVLCGLEKFEDNNVLKLVILSAGIALAYIMSTDYSFYGVIIIAVLYLYRFNNVPRIFWLCFLLVIQNSMEAFAVLSVPFIMKYDSDKNDVCLPKYFFYVFYPAHLLILCIIKFCFV